MPLPVLEREDNLHEKQTVQYKDTPFVLKKVLVRLTNIGSSGTLLFPTDDGSSIRSKKSESRSRVLDNTSISRVVPQIRSPQRLATLIDNERKMLKNTVKVNVVTDSEDSAVENLLALEGVLSKPIYLNKPSTCYKRVSCSKRKRNLVQVDYKRGSKLTVTEEKSRVSDIDTKSSRKSDNASELILDSDQSNHEQNNYDIADFKINKCVVRLEKARILGMTSSQLNNKDEVSGNMDTSEDSEVSFNLIEPSDHECNDLSNLNVRDTSSDSVTFNSVDTSSDSGLLMIKFIDGTGQDITKTVKEKSNSPSRKVAESSANLVDYDDSTKQSSNAEIDPRSIGTPGYEETKNMSDVTKSLAEDQPVLEQIASVAEDFTSNDVEERKPEEWMVDEEENPLTYDKTSISNKGNDVEESSNVNSSIEMLMKEDFLSLPLCFQCES